MPIDKKELRRYVEELGFSEAVAANVMQELEADDKRATQFVGQRLRQDDYSRKTQDLAQQRQQIDQAITAQVQEYTTKLQEADGKIAKILKDFENEQISRATAENRLRTLATKYEIPKEDLADLIKDTSASAPPRQEGGGLTVDAVTGMLAKFKESLVKELMPDLLSFPRISNIQQEIRDQHFELTGKRLTAAQMDELMTEATKDNSGGLVKVWESKFEIPKIRMDAHDKQISDSAVAEYERKLKAKASEDAIATVHNQDSTRPYSASPVLRQYRDRSLEDGQPGGDKRNGKGNGNGSEKPPEPRMSGAERAAVKWVERRNQGVGFGKEAPVK